MCLSLMAENHISPLGKESHSPGKFHMGVEYNRVGITNVACSVCETPNHTGQNPRVVVRSKIQVPVSVDPLLVYCGRQQNN